MWKHTYLFFLGFCMFCYGTVTGITGVTLIDILYQTHSSEQLGSTGIVCRYIGYGLGSLFTGRLYDRFSRQLCFVIILIACGVAHVAIPFVKQIALFIVAQIVVGVTSGGIEVAINTWMMNMYGAKCNGHMQEVYLSMAIGITVTPLFSAPFLSETKTANDTVSEIKVIEVIRPSQIIVPYSVVSVLMFLSAFVLFLLYIWFPYTDKKRTTSTSETNKWSSIFSPDLIFSCLLFCSFSGMELNTQNYLPTFVSKTAAPSDQTIGAYIAATFSAAYALSRLGAIFLALKMSARNILYACFAISFLAIILMILLSETYLSVLWLAAGMLGLGFGPVIPSAFAYLAQRIAVTNSHNGLVCGSKSLSRIITPLITGFFIEKHPLVYAYINLFCLLSCSLFLATLHFRERFTS